MPMKIPATKRMRKPKAEPPLAGLDCTKLLTQLKKDINFDHEIVMTDVIRGVAVIRYKPRPDVSSYPQFGAARLFAHGKSAGTWYVLHERWTHHYIAYMHCIAEQISGLDEAMHFAKFTARILEVDE